MKAGLVALSLILAAAGCAQRESTGGASSAGGTTVSSQAGGLSKVDSQFVQEAAQAGLAEVRMGELAAQRAQDQALRDFGQHLVEDHSRANEELARLAVEKGAILPTQMAGNDRQMIERLTQLSGAEFDQRLHKDAIQAHERAIKQFEKAAENCQDPDLRAFAQKNLPVLREHLKMAQQVSPASTTGSQGGTLNQGGSVNPF